MVGEGTFEMCKTTNPLNEVFTEEIFRNENILRKNILNQNMIEKKEENMADLQ